MIIITVLLYVVQEVVLLPLIRWSLARACLHSLKASMGSAKTVSASHAQQWRRRCCINTETGGGSREK